MGIPGDCMMPMGILPMGTMQYAEPVYTDPVYTDPCQAYDMHGYPMSYVQPQFLEDTMGCAPVYTQPMQEVWGWDPCLGDSMAQEYVFQQPQPRQEAREERGRSEAREPKDKEDLFLYPGHPAYSPIDVTIKNTFIDLPAPRTPSPNSIRAAKTPVANTCPPKFCIGNAALEQWEETQADAEEAAALFAAGKDRTKAAPAFDHTTSVGSLLHRAQLCKPCAWFHHAKGCQRGVRCEFCHCCPPGEIKKRKKEKTVLIRKRRTQQHGYTHDACSDYTKPCPVVPQYEIPQCW